MINFVIQLEGYLLPFDEDWFRKQSLVAIMILVKFSQGD